MYTNNQNIPLALAVWLAHDTYDGSSNPNYLSATSFNRSTKELVLSRRVPKSKQKTDIADLVPSRMGTALHDSIETAWVNNYKVAMANLNYPEKVINRVRINPSDEEIAADSTLIPVYMENRAFVELDGFIVAGKYDLIAEGTIEDYKSTKVFSYQKSTNDRNYIIQMSIYRYLNQDKVTNEHFNINYIFTDWMRSKANIDPTYPPTQVLQKTFNLMSVQETEDLLRSKIKEVKDSMDLDEYDLIDCTDEDLWRTASAWKYYKDPTKLARSTKNFDNPSEANTRLLKDGNKGVVIEVKGEVKKCNYCSAFPVCKQKDAYLADGTLKLF